MSLSTPRWFKARRTTSTRRRGSRCPIEVGRLEGRLLMAGDITPPVTVAQVVPNTLNGTGYYTASPETINLIASDPDSPTGLTTYYSVDNSGFIQGNTLQLGNGDHTLQFYSIDSSGNREATHIQVFNIDATVPVVTAVASPNTLWPPNHKDVRVTVSGHVFDASGGVPSTVHYTVSDEYNPGHPFTGTAPVNANSDYSFIILLQASRRGQDKNGRLYTIRVTATDEAGNVGSVTTYVVVPHDQGHRASTSGGSSSTSQGGNHTIAHNGTHGVHGNTNAGNHSGTKGNGKSGHGNGHGHGNGQGTTTTTTTVPAASGSTDQGHGNGGQGQGSGNSSQGLGNSGIGNSGHGNNGNGNGNGHGDGNGNGHGNG